MAFRADATMTPSAIAGHREADKDNAKAIGARHAGRSVICDAVRSPAPNG
jgi:hypothetical protein